MRQFIAFVLVLVFVITLPLALLAFNVGRVLFDGTTAKQAVTREVTESNLIATTLEWYAKRRAQERVLTGQAQTGIREPDALKALEFVSPDNWRKIKTLVLPNQFLSDWVGVSFDGVNKWIDTNDPLPNIILEFKAWKEYERGAPGKNAIQIVYDSLPACKPADIDDFQKRLAAAKPGQEILYNLYTPCMFPDPWKPDQNQDYLDSQKEIIDNVSDRFFLTQELAQIDKQARVGADSIKQQLRTIRSAANLALIVPLVMIVLLLVLGLRSQLDLARWVGIPIVVGGILSLLPTLAYPSIIAALLSAGPLSEVPPQVSAEFIRAVGAVVAEIFQPMLYESLAILFVGLVVTVLGIMRGRGKKAA